MCMYKPTPEFKEAKAELAKIQQQINDLKIQEKKAKKKFLKTLPMEEDFFDVEGDMFQVVGIQFHPEPIALVEYNGTITHQDLHWIEEQFKTQNNCKECFSEIPEDKELCLSCKEEDTYPCVGCGVEIPATEPYCSDCSKKMERALAA